MQVPGKSPIEASGRGARFLSLVKQNKLNVSPQLVNKRRFSACKALLADRDEAKPNQDTCDSKEYLKFSTQIKFDPDASPSSSILSKRKADPGIPEVSPLTSSMKVSKSIGGALLENTFLKLICNQAFLFLFFPFSGNELDFVTRCRRQKNI